MNPAAANAFLKNLEEPKENYHYVLQTEKLSRILPTIISRSEVFILKHNNNLREQLASLITQIDIKIYEQSDSPSSPYYDNILEDLPIEQQISIYKDSIQKLEEKETFEEYIE